MTLCTFCYSGLAKCCFSGPTVVHEGEFGFEEIELVCMCVCLCACVCVHDYACSRGRRVNQGPTDLLGGGGGAVSMWNEHDVQQVETVVVCHLVCRKGVFLCICSATSYPWIRFSCLCESGKKLENT